MPWADDGGCGVVVGHGDWEAQNLRWKGDEPLPRLAAVAGTTGVGTGLGSSRLWAELGFYDGSSCTSFSSELGLGLALSRALVRSASTRLALQ